jgi:hypothetical protein
MSFVSFPSIEGFHNVRKEVLLYNLQQAGMPINYLGKIKLHGTNAGVQIKANGDVFAQSRSATISIGNDNAGFAAWVEANKEFFADLRGRGKARDDEQITIFGEWCGSGIQKGVAISNIGRKIFAPFMLQYGQTDDDNYGKGTRVVVEPSLLSNVIGEHKDIFVLPWVGKSNLVMDFYDDDSTRAAIARANDLVAEVEPCDPWVKAVFDVEGTGEGIVFYPYLLNPEAMTRWHFSTFGFKAKGEKHKVVKTRAAVQIEPEVASSIAEFVEMFVTEARLEQGVREVARGELVFEARLIGPFLGWFNKDVAKESTAELAAAKLEWKDVSKAVSSRAREWYLKKMQEI